MNINSKKLYSVKSFSSVNSMISWLNENSDVEVVSINDTLAVWIVFYVSWVQTLQTSEGTAGIQTVKTVTN